MPRPSRLRRRLDALMGLAALGALGAVAIRGLGAAHAFVAAVLANAAIAFRALAVPY